MHLKDTTTKYRSQIARDCQTSRFHLNQRSFDFVEPLFLGVLVPCDTIDLKSFPYLLRIVILVLTVTQIG
jgi:hypothetical protein